MENRINIFENLIQDIPKLAQYHSPKHEVHKLLKKILKQLIAESLNPSHQNTSIELNPFGQFIFPFHKMGAVNSLNLFELDEFIIFSFYWLNRNRYKSVADIGANLGLHSIILSKCGYEVRCFEPDPNHYSILKENLALNNITQIKTFNNAVSTNHGELEFIRVLGNTTGSHIAGAKTDPYGKLEKFPVQTVSFSEAVRNVDLAKIDIEGHEKEVLLSTHPEDWNKLDALVEIQSEENAKSVYEHFLKLEVNLFSQKNNWDLVKSFEDMPYSYKDGTLFISKKEEMPWS